MQLIVKLVLEHQYQILLPQLEVVAADKGVLIPRVNLKNSTDTTTIANVNVNSLLVLNAATISDITLGYYYW